MSDPEVNDILGITPKSLCCRGPLIVVRDVQLIRDVTGFAGGKAIHKPFGLRYESNNVTEEHMQCKECGNQFTVEEIQDGVPFD